MNVAREEPDSDAREGGSVLPTPGRTRMREGSAERVAGRTRGELWQKEEEPRRAGQEGKPADGAASEGRDLRTGVRPGSVAM